MTRRFIRLSSLLLLTCLSGVTSNASTQADQKVFLPVVANVPEPMVEFRGLWVSRFDWTDGQNPADPAKIDEVVANAAQAGFNAIFFQVRGTADAFYTPGLEPWSQRVSGVALGQPPNPSWDPLATFVQKAHAHGIQLHAYLNVYPVWSDCNHPPDAAVTPKHLYYLLLERHGSSNGKINGLQWIDGDTVYCSAYQLATPASVFADDHLVAVATDLATRYDIDGIHLDYIRYGGENTSCDPVSEARYGADCFSNPGYADWQREQVNGTVRRFYQEVAPLKPGLWLSAAVWPIYVERPEWGWGGWATEGYHTYYQDSKAWLATGIIDSISPMIYPAGYNCPDNSFWSQDKWQTLVTDFQTDRAGRFVIPGIGAGYCTFDEIEARIGLARQIGTAGHALFAYAGLLQNGYFDDLAQGPYAAPAVPPAMSWQP